VATSRDAVIVPRRPCFVRAEGGVRLPVSAESGRLDESAQMATKQKAGVQLCRERDRC
jgi:hypothetical protein